MKKTTNPLISIVMPVYNPGSFLPQAIESILNQTYQNFEFIIVNDGSTDNSLKTIKSYSKIDKRIKVFNNPRNMGVSYTANLAISKAKGQYIARMDSDDIAFPDRLEKQLKFLQKHPKTIAVGGQCIIINENNQIIGNKKFPTDYQKLRQMIFWAIPMQQPSVMINTKLLPPNFVWYFANRPYGEDVGFIFRLLQCGQIANLPDFTLYYRTSPNSLLHRKLRETFNSTILSRLQAIREGQRPTLFAIFYNIVQILAVNLLPAFLICEIWDRVRGIKETKLNSTLSVPNLVELQSN